jgi:arylsulfatase A
MLFIKYLHMNKTERSFILVFALSLILLIQSCTNKPESPTLPNIVIIFCDDLGYGDLGTFGHPTIRTPNIDKMAEEGQKWTNFYVGASVCTPSRAALLTGRLPVRSGMCGNRRVLFPDSPGGLQDGEVTIAEVLKSRGYSTACVGKWHLGHLPEYLPTRHGFDSYFGIPYSNDMDFRKNDNWIDWNHAMKEHNYEFWNVPLMRDEEIIERPAVQTTITKRYTEEAIEFIRTNKDRPFFLYLAHNLPHVPLFTSETFRDVSFRGLYGDVVEEIDWGVGQLLEALRTEGLDENTMVVFTSDNGPWLVFDQHGGSAGLLREGKGTTWEGGMRVPAIFWWPGKIMPGVITDMGSTMDLFTTACRLTGADLPDDRIMDGVDLSSSLFDEGEGLRNTMFYYRRTELYAVRKGMYKAHFITEPVYVKDHTPTHHDPPLLFHLGEDPSEKYNIARDHPEIIADIIQEVGRHQAGLVIPESQLDRKE